jgi:beta-lactamase regulating signal transducer with metallopeptidase domain
MTSMMLGDGPLGLLAKVSAILVCTAIVATMLLRASAALRHTVWLAGLAASLGLAVAWPFAPRVDVTLLPARRSSEAMTTVTAASTPRAFRAARAARPVANAIRTFPPTAATRRWTRMAVAVGLPRLLFAGWLLGMLVMVARTIIGHVIVGRIVRGARDVSVEWTNAVRPMRDARIQRDVSILISDEIQGPVTAGFLNPVVVVPLSASAWSNERREIVLTHELAHIARFDFVAQFIASITCAVFWFHPLAWIAAARLRAEAEHAADDRVLAGGTPGVSYATHLLDLARVESSTRLSAAVAVGMVRASRLEGRVRAMLDLDRSRATVSPRVQAFATSLTLAAMVPVAGLRAISAPMPVPAFLAQATQVSAESLFEKTITAKSGEVLTLDLKTGGNVTIRGWDQEQVRVRARLAGEDWRDTRVDLERWAGGVRLHSEFDGTADRRSTRHSFEIWVPRRMSLDLESSGGSLALNDVTGEFRGQTGGGSMIIEGAKGSARLSTGGGNVRVTNSALDGSVSTGGGEVIIANVTGGLRASSGSGPVIHVPGIIEPASTIVGGVGSNATTATIFGSVGSNATTVTSSGSGGGVVTSVAGGVGRTISSNGGGYATISSNDGGYATSNRMVMASGVTTIMSSTSDRMFGSTSGYVMSKAGGPIEVTEAPNGAQLRTGGGHVWVGSANGMLGVSTGGGDIDLPRVGGSVSAWTGAGDVTITVVDAGNPEHSVDVFTGRGRVVLELPSNLDARFELETAYTESKPRTNIESDFSLQASETMEWDESQGTPRKFVRAQGRVGNGRGLIRIRVVNGDIIVRRGR